MNAASHLFDTTAGAGWQQTPNVTDVVVGQGRVMKVDITSFGAFVAAAGCADCGLDGGDGGDGPGSN
jgi:hypothetical protein